MSVFDLREFNTLSKRHNYFLTNNRIEGFPNLTENSLILRKILECRNSNSSDKRFENNKIKPKKVVRFTKPENIPYSKIYQSPILIKKKHNNSNGINKPRRLLTNLSKNDNLRSIAFNSNNQIIMSPCPEKDNDNEINKHLVKPTYYKIQIYSKKAYNSPEANNPRSPTFNNVNSFDNEIDQNILSFNGKKFFTNSFCGINSDAQSISPEKNMDNKGSKIGTELFRNYEELRKKKDEIYKRKIKKNPITTREQFYEKQKGKEIKRRNLNIQFQDHIIDVSNDENKMRIIPITKKRLNNINNINNIKRINNRFRTKKRNNNSNNSINFNHKSLSYIINDNNNNSMNRTVFNKSNINNSNSFNNINNFSFSNPKSKNNILYSKKSFKSNNIYMSKYSSPGVANENNILENSDTIRKKYDKIESPDNDYNNKTHSLERHNNPYNFIVPKKRFVEDYTFKKEIAPPVLISSDDHKVCIKMHILHGINEIFFGKVKTKERLKMQRVISICFVKEKEKEKEKEIENNNNENEKKNVMVGANFIKNKNPINKLDLKSLSSIKEEEEKSKSKLEHDIQLKNEIKQEIKEENVEENNNKKDEKITPNPDLDKNKVKDNQGDNQNVRIKLLKEKPDIELIKLETKVKMNDNQISDNNIKRRRFQRSYPRLETDLGNEPAKVEVKEENNFRNNIRRKYEKSKDKSETKKNKPIIENKDNKNSDKNFRRRFQRSNPKPEIEVAKNETKEDKKENQNQIGEIKSFRRRFQRSNPKTESDLNKNEQKNDLKDINENKNQIKNKENNNNEQKEKEKDEKTKMESKPKLIEIEQNIEIGEKSNFRRNYRSKRIFEKSYKNLPIKKDTNNETKEKKNLEEKTKRRFTKIESEKNLKEVPSTESKENLNTNNRIAVRRFRRLKLENELKPGPVRSSEKDDKKENQNQNANKNNRRRFRKSETEITFKYNVKENQNIEKDNIKKNEKLVTEQQKPSLNKDKPKNEMEEKQISENNFRKRYVRRFGKVK